MDQHNESVEAHDGTSTAAREATVPSQQAQRHEYQGDEPDELWRGAAHGVTQAQLDDWDGDADDQIDRVAVNGLTH